MLFQEFLMYPPVLKRTLESTIINEYDEDLRFYLELVGLWEACAFPPPKNLKKQPCLLLVALMTITLIKGDHFGRL